MSALRPSNLPKLAACPCYEGRADAGPAARRGSLLDSAFRADLLGLEERFRLADKLTADEIASVCWATTMVRAMAGSERVLAREDDCRAAMCGMTGTADAIVPSRLRHFDLKTGARRNYREQMAAYALGLMEAAFATRWTAHLLFCDLREVETLAFTHEEAKDIVAGVVAAFSDPGKSESPCEYCSWCARADTCPARLALVGEALASTDPGFDFDAVVADPEKLGRFLAACATAGEFGERAGRIAIDRIRTGGSIPGWRLAVSKGGEFVDCLTVGHHIKRMGFGPVLAAYGNLPANKFRQLWAERMPADTPFPEEAVLHAPSTPRLKQTTSKPKQQKDR